MKLLFETRTDLVKFQSLIREYGGGGMKLCMENLKVRNCIVLFFALKLNVQFVL